VRTRLSLLIRKDAGNSAGFGAIAARRGSEKRPVPAAFGGISLGRGTGNDRLASSEFLGRGEGEPTKVRGRDRGGKEESEGRSEADDRRGRRVSRGRPPARAGARSAGRVPDESPVSLEAPQVLDRRKLPRPNWAPMGLHPGLPRAVPR
jgi:hypothetical protein